MQSTIAPGNEYVRGPVIRVSCEDWAIVGRNPNKKVAFRFVEVLANEATSHSLPHVSKSGIQILGDEVGNTVLETFLLHIGERHVVGISTHPQFTCLGRDSDGEVDQEKRQRSFKEARTHIACLPCWCNAAGLSLRLQNLTLQIHPWDPIHLRRWLQPIRQRP